MDNESVRQLAVTILLAIALLAGCSRAIDGTPAMTSRDVDPAYFFDGAVDTYGHALGAVDVTALAYLRALRRVDPCGLVTREALAMIGGISAVGTLFALDEVTSTSSRPVRPTADTSASN